MDDIELTGIYYSCLDKENTMTNNNTALANFFKTVISYYIVPDLKRLRHEVRPQGEQAQAGCAIPTAMLAISVLDILGYLMRTEVNAKKHETGKNIKHFLCNTSLFPNVYEKWSDIIVELFRHGIMHQIFPKACGIAKPSPANHQIIFYTDKDTPNLNVDVLVDDLLTALEKLQTMVQSDPDLAQRMNQRLELIQKDDIEARQTELKDVKLHCPPDVLFTTTTTTPA